MSSTGVASGSSTAAAVGVVTSYSSELPLLQLPFSRVFMREGFAVEVMPVFGDAPMTTGSARRRRTYLEAPRTLAASLELSLAETVLFNAWYEGPLKAGAEFFSAQVINDGPGLLWWKTRLIEYTANYLGGQFWKVDTKLMIFGEGHLVGPETSALAGGVIFDLLGTATVTAIQALVGGVRFDLLAVAPGAGGVLVGGVTFALLAGTYIAPASRGSAAGTSTAAAFAPGVSNGNAAGTSTALGVSIGGSIGSAAGSSTALGVGIGASDFWSGYIGAPTAKTYKVVVKASHGGTIDETTTISESGTGTATFKINTTALGGTANAVSSSEDSQAQTSANVFAAGDDIQITMSSLSSLVGMSFTIKYRRTP